MKLLLLVLTLLIVSSASNALFLPQILKALGLQKTSAPTIPVAPPAPAPTERTPLPPLPEQPPSAHFAVYRTQHMVETPWFPSTWQGFLPFSGDTNSPQVPIQPNQVQSINVNEIEHTPIIVGSGYAFRPQ